MKDFFYLVKIYFYNSANIIFNTIIILFAKLFNSIDSYKDFYCLSIQEGFEQELLPKLLNDKKIKIDECEEVIYVAIAYNTIPLIMFPSIRNEIFDKCSASIIRRFRWQRSIGG